jgi:hypothetical protein
MELTVAKFSLHWVIMKILPGTFHLRLLVFYWFPGCPRPETNYIKWQIT